MSGAAFAKQVRDNVKRSRYELVVDGQIAIAAYRRQGDVIAITHTEVPPAIGGRGVGTTLVAAALADIRERHLQVLPACPFVARYIEKHSELSDLVAIPPA